MISKNQGETEFPVHLGEGFPKRYGAVNERTFLDPRCGQSLSLARHPFAGVVEQFHG